jgi:hypothetical protein
MIHPARSFLEWRWRGADRYGSPFSPDCLAGCLDIAGGAALRCIWLRWRADDASGAEATLFGCTLRACESGLARATARHGRAELRGPRRPCYRSGAEEFATACSDLPVAKLEICSALQKVRRSSGLEEGLHVGTREPKTNTGAGSTKMCVPG